MLKNAKLIEEIYSYISKHIADEGWHLEQFDFVKDDVLRGVLAREFISARRLYKLLEAIGANGDMLITQSRVQVVMYASIYEAVLNYVLFKEIGDCEAVRCLKVRNNVLTRIDIPENCIEKLRKCLSHDGKEIFASYYKSQRIDESKIKFSDKLLCAERLKVISHDLSVDIASIYKTRNSIHIDAEIKHNTNYNLELSRLAYRKMSPFCAQIRAFLSKNPN